MDKAAMEQSIFELVTASLASAGGLINEPPAYGALRVTAMIRDLVAILDRHGLSSPRLDEVRRRIVESAEGGMLGDEDRKKFLDGMLMQCLDMLD